MHFVRTAGKPAAVALVSFFVAYACSEMPAAAGGPKYSAGGPYRSKGRSHRAQAGSAYDRVGVASWYGAAFHGRRTANGERYDMHALTAAHPTLPLSTVVVVTNLDNGRSVAVRINDRGPYARNRIIDMSQAGARVLGFTARGTARVRVTVVDSTTTVAGQAGKTPATPGPGATGLVRPAATRPRRRKHGDRGRGRGRPAARPSYLR
jgi:rare lipoprotein A